MAASLSPNDNLLIPAFQAIPTLCRRYNVDCDLPTEVVVPGLTARGQEALMKRRTGLLEALLIEHALTWPEVFSVSDIGRERSELAKHYLESDSDVLDIGCGRGYFTFSAAMRSAKATGIDIMDGEQRRGWWARFIESSRSLGIGTKVTGVRSSGSATPFGEDSFDVAASVHSLRNFRSHDEARAVIKEMRRVLRKGGRILIAESTMTPNTPGEEVYVALYRLRTRQGWELELPDEKKLAGWLTKTGFKHVEADEHEFNMAYAPVGFYPGDLENRTDISDYKRIEKSWIAHGESGPPVMVVTATK